MKTNAGKTKGAQKWLNVTGKKLNILIYFEFRSKPSLITVICMDPHSPNKLFATKYCFLILVDDASFFVFISFFFFFLFFFFLLLFYVIINFYKNHFIIIIILFYFFMNFFFISSCSGMFRHVPECSVFRVLSTPLILCTPPQIFIVAERSRSDLAISPTHSGVNTSVKYPKQAKK